MEQKSEKLINKRHLTKVCQFSIFHVIKLMLSFLFSLAINQLFCFQSVNGGISVYTIVALCTTSPSAVQITPYHAFLLKL